MVENAADQIDIAIGSVDELEALLKHASSSVRVHLNPDTTCQLWDPPRADDVHDADVLRVAAREVPR